MALKITTQIGTDRGITNEAYVRLSDYQISKSGTATFRIELFQNKDAAIKIDSVPGPIISAVSRNQDIGDMLFVDLKKNVSTPITKTVTTTSTGPDGKPVVTTEDVTENVNTIVANFSEVEASNIFVYGYNKLREKLKTIFGDKNVVDC